MYRRLTAGLAALTLVGCAHEAPKPEAAAQAQPTQSAEKISNLVPFDLYNCFPRKVNVPAPPNPVGVTALWAAAQPQIQECLIDPKSRGPQDKTTVTVDATSPSRARRSTSPGRTSPPRARLHPEGAGQRGPGPVGGGGRQAGGATKLGAQHVLGQSPGGAVRPERRLGHRGHHPARDEGLVRLLSGLPRRFAICSRRRST